MATGGGNERLRFSVCVDAKTMFEGPQVSIFTAKNIKKAKGLLDELCWLRTVVNTETDAAKFEVDVFALKQISVWKKMLAECNDAHVKLMIGYAHASTLITKSATAFLTWLYAPTPSPSIKAWAEKLRDFCKPRFPGMAGVSFDLENLGHKAAPVPKDDPARRTELDRRGKRWSEFYGGVADVFQAEGWMVGAFLKPKIADDRSTKTLPDDTARLHLYEMAKGHPNLILRPMAYEANPAGGMTAWFKDICDYAVGTVQADGTLSGGKCAPENFQLTLKVATSRDPAAPPVTDDAGRPVPELGIVPPVPTVTDACKQVFRPHQVGICLFPGGAGVMQWNDLNQALNNSVAGSKKGWPIQHPLAQDPVDEFKK
jgi:hypothetical protein